MTRLSKGDAVIDVGAHIGLFTLKCLCQGATLVIAVEPHPDNARLLRTNISMNKLDDKVILIEAAAGSKRGKAKLYISKESGRHSLLSSEYELKTSINVNLVTLDEIASKLHRIDYVKIDVEGSELEVVKGSEEIIKRFKPIFVIETHKKKLAYLAKVFHHHGYAYEIFPYGYHGQIHLYARPRTM